MSSPSSLFSQGSMGEVALQLSDNEPGDLDQLHVGTVMPTASMMASATRKVPPIPGLHVFSGLLEPDAAQNFLDEIIQADHFVGGTRDQVMFFGTMTPSLTSSATSGIRTGIPAHLLDLSTHLSQLLSGLLPPDTWDLVFEQNLARQCILNLYPPGQGISSHIDLPHRYADGIVGVSILGGTVMDFTHPTNGSYSLYLPPRSVYVLSGEARWEWAHGIQGRVEDVVDGETIGRGVRVSATFRWMKEGADVLS